MILAGITVTLFLIALGFYIYGVIGLAKYAFRLGSGQGFLVIFCALFFWPYIVYFALYKLREEGLEWPTFSYFFGIVTMPVLVLVFGAPLGHLVRGEFDQLRTKGAGAAVKEYQTEDEGGSDESDDSADQETSDESDEASQESGDDETASESESDDGTEKAAEKEKGASEESGSEKGDSDKGKSGGSEKGS